MAQGFLHTGFRAQVITASGGILKNAIIMQEGITGVAQTAIPSGGTGWMGVEGVWNLPVPVMTFKGTPLYLPAVDTNSGVLDNVITGENRSQYVLFGVAESDRDSNGYAHVRLAQSTQQVMPFTPQASPTGTAAAIIQALEDAGIFVP
jgi:predicted RecA/RadA family phage recombinase